MIFRILFGRFEGSEPRILSGIFGKMCWSPMGDLHSFGRTWGALGVRNVANLLISYEVTRKKGTMLPGSLRINTTRQLNGRWREWEGRHTDIPTVSNSATKQRRRQWQGRSKLIKRHSEYFRIICLLTYHLLFLFVGYGYELLLAVAGSCLGSSCKRRAELSECRCHRQNGIQYQKSWQRCFSTVCLGT